MNFSSLSLLWVRFNEGRIRDLIDDVLFPMAFKGVIPTVTMKNPRQYWCIMSNKALMGISNHADPHRPWTGALTSRVLANRTSWAVQILSLIQ